MTAYRKVREFLEDVTTGTFWQIVRVPDWHYLSYVRSARVEILQATWAWDALEFV